MLPTSSYHNNIYSPEGDSSLTPPRPPPPTSGGVTPQTAPVAVHRWPLRPGVQVHVNGARSLGRDAPTPTSSSDGTPTRYSTPIATTTPMTSTSITTVPAVRNSRKRSAAQALRRDHALPTNTVVPRGSATVFPTPSSSMQTSTEAGGNHILYRDR
jgi:hypothetical protein